ncbi:MAG: VCBS repeat-containing protein [Deinococcaceae bacterium]
MSKFVSLSVLSALLLASCQMRSTPSVAPQMPSPLQTKGDASLSSLGSFVVSIGEDATEVSTQDFSGTTATLSALPGTMKFFDKGKYRYFSMVVRAYNLPVTVNPNSVIFIPVAGGGISDTPFTEMKTAMGATVDPKIRENVVPMGGSMDSKSVWPLKGVPKLILDPWPNLQVFPASEVASVAPEGKVAFPVGFAGKRVAARTADILLSFAVPKSTNPDSDLASMKIQGVLVTETKTKTVSESREERTGNYNKGTSSVETSTMITRLNQIKVGLMLPLRVTTFAGSTLSDLGTADKPVNSMYSVCYNPTGLSLKNNYAVSSMENNLHGSTFYSMKPSVAELAGLQSAIKVTLPCGDVKDKMSPFKQMVVQDFQQGQRLDASLFAQDPLVGWSYGEVGTAPPYMPGSEVEVTMTDPDFARSFVGRFRVGSGKEGAPGFVGGRGFELLAAPAEILPKDLNKDGKMDVVVRYSAQTNVSVFLGNGDGTFQARQDITFSELPIAILFGNYDATSDGNTDMIVVGKTKFSTFPGVKGGTFDASKAVANSSFSGVTILAAANDRSAATTTPDPDGMDLAIAYSNGMGTHFSVLKNTSDLTFAFFSGGDTTNTKGTLTSIAIGSVTDKGDVFDDVVIGTSTDTDAMNNRIKIFKGDASGNVSLTVPDMSVALGSVDGDVKVKLAYMDNDSDIDLVFAQDNFDGMSGFGVGIAKGNGMGFAPPLAIVNAGLSGPIYPVSLGGSDAIDILTPSAKFIDPVIALPTASGIFNGSVSPGTSFSAVASADFDNDGKMDFIGGAGSVMALFNGTGTGGNFEYTVDSVLASSQGFVTSADMNKDGTLDTLSVAPNAIFLNLASLRTVTGVTALAVGDFNHDSNPDLVFNSGDKIQIFKGKGDGTLDTQLGTDLTIPVTTPRRIVVGDLNGDGNLDIVTANNSTSVSVFLSKAAPGQFEPIINLQLQTGATSADVAIGDINGDYRMDIVAVDSSSADKQISMFLNGGMGNTADRFTEKTIDINLMEGSTKPSSVVLADFDKDGKLDIAVSSGDKPQLGVYKRNWDGTFGGEMTLRSNAAFGQTGQVVTGDFQGDGWLDLATVTGNSVAVFTNNRVGGFSAPDFWTSMRSGAAISSIATFASNGTVAMTNTKLGIVAMGNSGMSPFREIFFKK